MQNTKMKIKITLTILLFSSFGAFAQISKEELVKELKPLNEKLKILQSENIKLKSEIGILNSKALNANKNLDSLRNETKANGNAITQTANKLSSKIKEIGDQNAGNIAKISKSLSKSSLYGIIGVLSAILTSGLLYWFLSKKQKTDKTDIIEQLSKTKSSIEESLVKEFGKQTDLIATQLLLIEQQNTTSQAKQTTEPDHSLALKVASEINLIERNIILMDVKTKGLKQLQASVGKLKDNLAANGYDMPELLGKQFHQGMRVIVTSSIPDETLEKDSEIISKILIPQVNYNDKMIQTAQIETSKG